MKRVPYINYDELGGFYTVQQVAAMFKLDLQKLLEKGLENGIRPFKSDSGCYFFDSTEVKMLHFRLYHESRGRKVK